MNSSLIQLKKHGQRMVAVSEHFELAPLYDTAFLKALGRAFYWQHQIDSGKAESGAAIALQEGMHKTSVNNFLRLALLCTDIVKMLMEGLQPRSMTLHWFLRNSFPIGWEEQLQLIADDVR